MQKGFKFYCTEVLKNIIAGCCMILTVSSCGEKLLENNDDCDPVYRVKFVYEMNMSGGDGFPAQVNSVDLWVFQHSTGELVGLFSDFGDALSEKDYTLSLDGLTPGEYDFIAWCGMKDSDSFTMPALSSVKSMTDLVCRLNTTVRDGVPTSGDLLSPLFYGALYAQTLSDRYGTYTYTVRLMKDTNNINLALQHVGGEPLDKDDFSIYMSVDNGCLGYDNAVIPSQEIVYYPWSVQSGSADFSGGRMNFLQMEISTLRLMAEADPSIVIIDNNTRGVIYSFPIVEWAKKLRSIQNLGMSDQEYLDREHEYTIMVHLIDDSIGWKAVSIVINGYEIY